MMRQPIILSVLLVVTVIPQSGKGEANKPNPQQNGTLRVGSFHLAVSDLERSKAFYRDKLGLALSVEEPGYMVGFQGGLLWLGPERLKLSPSPALPVIVVLFTSSAREAYQNLKAKRVEIAAPPQDDPRGTRSFSFKDPDGYTIQIVQPLPLLGGGKPRARKPARGK